MTDYLVYDVFTDRPFSGNQLAVVPEAAHLTQEAMQAIAREFNFSESTFVLPPDDPAHTARVRIFTPTKELPFAGHPTIGTAVALAERGMGTDQVLELGVGPIAARAQGRSAAFETGAPLQILHDLRPDHAAACLGLDATAVAGPVQMASLGLPFVMTELASPDLLADIAIDRSAFQDAAGRYKAASHFAVFAWAETEGGIRARMFSPLDGIDEDPATGSACATLGALLASRRGAKQSLTIRQGVEMGRPSTIMIEADGTSVTVRGDAVRVMEGRLSV